MMGFDNDRGAEARGTGSVKGKNGKKLPKTVVTEAIYWIGGGSVCVSGFIYM